MASTQRPHTLGGDLVGDNALDRDLAGGEPGGTGRKQEGCKSCGGEDGPVLGSEVSVRHIVQTDASRTWLGRFCDAHGSRTYLTV
jgi:hypothetical protein